MFHDAFTVPIISYKIHLQTKANICICYRTAFIKITISFFYIYVHFYFFKNVNDNMHYYYQRWAIDIFHCKAFCEIPDKKNNRRLVSVILEQFLKKNCSRTDE